MVPQGQMTRRVFALLALAMGVAGCALREQSGGRQGKAARGQRRVVVRAEAKPRRIPFTVILSINGTDFKPGETIEIKVRIENPGEFDFVAVNPGAPWYEKVVAIADVESIAKRDGINARLPDGTPSPWLTASTTGLISSAFGLHAHDALEHTFRFAAKRPGEYLARAQLRSVRDWVLHYTGKSHVDTVKVPLQGGMLFKTEPLQIKFKVRGKK